MSDSIEGMEALEKKLADLTNEAKLTTAIQQCCALVEGSAKTKAPKDTGALKRSITSKVINDGGEIKGSVYTPLEYAPYIEYGTGLFAEKSGRTDVPWKYQDEKGEWHTTKGIKPSPYLRPALLENKNQILKTIQEAIKP